jgi:isoleucyl-tRNA synthetase
MIAPVTPYLAERMYQHLDGTADTVHALGYPEVDADRHDPDLEEHMAVLRDVEEAAANARQQGGRKLRWPVSRVVVESDEPAVREAVESLSELLAERVNAREVSVVERFDELVERAEPRMSEIGPAFGGDSQTVMEAVEGATRDEVEAGVEADGETYELDDSMVEYRAEPPEGISGADFDTPTGGGSVYVDTTLTEELESEGYARDVVRRVQEMRKELELDVEEPIRTRLDVADDRVAGFVDDHRGFVAEETRTAEWIDGDDAAFDLVERWEVEGVDVTIGVKRVEGEGEGEDADAESAPGSA